MYKRQDLTLPEGVKATLNDDVVVAIVAKTRVSQSEEAAADEAEAAAEPAAEAAAE